MRGMKRLIYGSLLSLLMTFLFTGCVMAAFMIKAVRAVGMETGRPNGRIRIPKMLIGMIAMLPTPNL